MLFYCKNITTFLATVLYNTKDVMQGKAKVRHYNYTHKL